MKAAVLEALNTPMVIHQPWPDPEPGPRDGIIRDEANAICRSDWHLWVGDWAWGLTLSLPRVIGHEYCGGWKRLARR
jgi:D-arabinose 1-dehydrogenase-like Zn-dependent alcohol dehydrogenase